ncbi:hypothetical protein SDC9_141835 [bioreactor metagenome]|uniref:Uncharacterized protein n=1 Tax=bioreactor metagenome TaxID=1076179 RepID=A0A645DZ91_9ZZZZ
MEASILALGRALRLDKTLPEAEFLQHGVQALHRRRIGRVHHRSKGPWHRKSDFRVALLRRIPQLDHRPNSAFQYGDIERSRATMPGSFSMMKSTSSTVL